MKDREEMVRQIIKIEKENNMEREKITEKDILDYKRRLETLAVIRNCVTLGCFTILSLVFHLWWIVLFSALFMVSVGKKGE